MEVAYGDEFLLLNQKNYVWELLAKVGIANQSSFLTPMTDTCLNHTSMDNCTDPFNDETLYRITIGVLQHICVTRPNIHFAVNKLSQYLQTPYTIHWKVVLYVLRYLKGTMNHGLLFRTNPSPTNDISLVSYSDVD